MIKFIIKGNPISSKNTRPIFINKATGQRFIGKSKRLKEYIEYALWQLMIGKTKYAKHNIFNYTVTDMPIYAPVSVSFIFYVKDKRKRDLINLCQLPADLLQQAKIIANDSQIVSLDGSRIYIDGLNPRTEISISSFKVDNPPK